MPANSERKYGGYNRQRQNLNYRRPNNDRRRNDKRRSPSRSDGMEFARSVRPLVNPWASGMSPVAQPLMAGFGQPTALMQIPSLAQFSGTGNYEMASFGQFTAPNKMRRIDSGQMAGYADQRGRGLLVSPSSAPLLGVAPTYGAEQLVQQPFGGTIWSPVFPSGLSIPKTSGFSSGNRQNNMNRRQRPGSNKNFGNNRGNRRPQQHQRPPIKRGGGRSQDARSRLAKSGSGQKDNKGMRDTKASFNKERTESTKIPAKSERSSSQPEDTVTVEEGKEELAGEVTVNDKDKKSEQKKIEDFYPVKALYCHVCDLDNFTTKKGYVRHLEGITHAKMSEIFHAKNAATLELLSISAKLSEMRQRDKVLRKTGKRGQPMRKTIEEYMVQKWMKVGSCCGTRYKSQFEMEEHKLSLNHLKAQYELKMEKEVAGDVKNDEEEEEGNPEDLKDDLMKTFNLIGEAKLVAALNPFTLKNLEPYDPNKPIGLQFIMRSLNFRCKVCKKISFYNLEEHCLSHLHYDNIIAYLNRQEELKREKLEKEKLKEGDKEDVKSVVDAEGESEQTSRELDKDSELVKETEERLEKQEDIGGPGEEDMDDDFVVFDSCEQSAKGSENGNDSDIHEDSTVIFDEVGDVIDFDDMDKGETKTPIPTAAETKKAPIRRSWRTRGKRSRRFK